MPWDRCFDALRKIGYGGGFTIEFFDQEIESVANFCCIWRKLADSQEHLAPGRLRFPGEAHAQSRNGMVTHDGVFPCAD